MQKSHDAVHGIVRNASIDNSESIWDLIAEFKKQYQNILDGVLMISSERQAISIWKLFNYFTQVEIPKSVNETMAQGGWFFGDREGNPTHFIIPQGNVDTNLISSAVRFGKHCVLLGIGWSIVVIDLTTREHDGLTYTTLEFTKKQLVEGRILPLIHGEFKSETITKKTYRKLGEIMMRIHQWKTIPKETRIKNDAIHTQINEYIEYTQGLIHNLTMGLVLSSGSHSDLDFDLKQCLRDIIAGGFVTTSDQNKLILLLHSITLELTELQDTIFFNIPLNFYSFYKGAENNTDMNSFMEIKPNTFS